MTAAAAFHSSLAAVSDALVPSEELAAIDYDAVRSCLRPPADLGTTSGGSMVGGDFQELATVIWAILDNLPQSAARRPAGARLQHGRELLDA